MCSVWWNRGPCAVCGGIGDRVQWCGGIGDRVQNRGPCAVYYSRCVILSLQMTHQLQD